jgi:hypothetical protein
VLDLDDPVQEQLVQQWEKLALVSAFSTFKKKKKKKIFFFFCFLQQ